ncbi:MAG: sigma-70 family RNA polymerase sigma factor [Ferruginibacter sp.]
MSILIGCKQQDPRHQKMFYERYRGTALKIVFRYIYNYEDGVEITNDGFVKFFLNIDKFKIGYEGDIEKMLNGWLKRIMINTAIDLLRRKMMLPEIGIIDDTHLNFKDDAAGSDKLLIYKDLIKLIKKLPPSYRVVFNMFVIDGYSHLEIAETMNIPVNTSKSNLARAKILMQDYINKIEQLVECSI